MVFKLEKRSEIATSLHLTNRNINLFGCLPCLRVLMM